MDPLVPDAPATTQGEPMQGTGREGSPSPLLQGGERELSALQGVLLQVQAALGRAFVITVPGIMAPDLNLAVQESIIGTILVRTLLERGFMEGSSALSSPGQFLSSLSRAEGLVSLPVTGTPLTVAGIPLRRTPLSHLLGGDPGGYTALSPLMEQPEGLFSSITPEEWADLFSLLLSRRVALRDGYRAEVTERQSVREAGGYAPLTPRLARYLAEEGLATLAGEGKNPRPSILDPCCGGGSLLLAALRALGGGGGAPPEECASLTREVLTGIDSDPRAVISTRFVLLLALLERAGPGDLPGEPGWHGLCNAVRWGDALVEPEPYMQIVTTAREGPEIHLAPPLSREDLLSRTPGNRGFGMVLLNPPAGGLPHHPPLREYYTMQYATATESDDPAPIFVERSLGLLRPGGVLAAISSRRWVRSAWGAPLRGLLLRSGLRHVAEILPGVPGKIPTGGLILFIVKEGSPGEEIRSATITEPSDENYPAAIRDASRSIPLSLLGAGGWSFTDTRGPRLAKAILAESRPLAEVLMGQIAGGNTGPRPRPYAQSSSREWFVSPADITPFQVRVPAHRRTGWDPTVASHIFIAALGGRIVSGFAPPSAEPGEGVVSLASCDPFLLAVLNSPVVTFCHTTFPQGSMEGRTPFTARAAGRLPVPSIDFDDPVASACHNRLTRVASSLATGDPPSEEVLREGMRLIMRDLALLYGLTGDDLAVIGLA